MNWHMEKCVHRVGPREPFHVVELVERTRNPERKSPREGGKREGTTLGNRTFSHESIPTKPTTWVLVYGRRITSFAGQDRAGVRVVWLFSTVAVVVESHENENKNSVTASNEPSSAVKESVSSSLIFWIEV